MVSSFNNYQDQMKISKNNIGKHLYYTNIYFTVIAKYCEVLNIYTMRINKKCVIGLPSMKEKRNHKNCLLP